MSYIQVICTMMKKCIFFFTERVTHRARSVWKYAASKPKTKTAAEQRVHLHHETVVKQSYDHWFCTNRVTNLPQIFESKDRICGPYYRSIVRGWIRYAVLSIERVNFFISFTSLYLYYLFVAWQRSTAKSVHIVLHCLIKESILFNLLPSVYFDRVMMTQ